MKSPTSTGSACWIEFFCAAFFFALGLSAEAYSGSWPPPANQTDTVAVVPISATVTQSPAAITLNFPRAGAYQIFRKDPQAGANVSGSSNPWGTALTTLPASSVVWTDTNVSVGQLYEYKAVCTSGTLDEYCWNPITYVGGSGYPTGYILTGINVDETQPRGRIILVVANDVPINLPNEYAQYIADLAADGWFVHVILGPRAANYLVSGSNALATVTVSSGGTGYVSGTGGTINHTTNVLLSNSNGTSVALGTLTVSSGVITAIPVNFNGGGFKVGDTLTLGNLSSGTGAVVTVGSVTSGSTNPIPIRNQIMAIYNQYPGQVKNVVLLGKVPACRTGASEQWDPDGHGVNLADYGADGYYANMTGTWTDVGSTYSYFGNNGNTIGGNLNLPGDNQFDQYYMSQTGGEADMGFGRIDLSNNIDGEYAALQFYLNKLHRYNIADPSFLPGRRIATRHGFSNTDETAWTCALNITGSLANIDPIANTTPPLPVVGAYMDADAAYSALHGPYLFYFKGDGGPQCGVGGKAVIWTGMQSHWGWWYSASVSSGENTLALRLGENSFALCWMWDIFGLRYFYHRMGMGFDAGDMMKVSINNYDGINGTYSWVTNPLGTDAPCISPCSGALFMDLFGDPALRLFMFAPPTNLSVIGTSGQPVLNWTASTEPTVTGYHVYRTPLVSGTPSGPATRITSSLVTGTSYTDTTVGAGSGQWSYLVRAVRLETTGGGTYYNASLGASQSVDMTNAPTQLQVVTGGTLPTACWNTPYQQPLVAQGGTPLYNWTVVSGALPPGLALASNGTISGTATTAGNYSFKAQASDALGQTAQQSFTISAQSDNKIILYPAETAYNIQSSPTRVQGDTEILQVSSGSNSALLRFNLQGLNINNSFISATLQLYVGAGTTANSLALLEAALSADAPGAAWDIGSVCCNNQPADNPKVPPVIATTFPVVGNYLNIDVTPLVRTALTSNTSGTVSFRLFTQLAQSIYLCSGYSYGAAIPELIIQTTNAPKITINSPTINPAYLYVNSGLQIDATVTAIAATSANLTTAWSLVSGPGTASFSSPSQPSTNVTFSAPGDYVLQLAANDGVLQSSQNLAVRVLTVPVGTAPATGLTNNLVLRMPLDETSGTVAHDVSGVNPPNSGGLAYVLGSSNPVWSSTGGVIGGALLLSGSGQQAIVPDSSTNLLDGGSQLSISFWMYANSLNSSGTNYMALVSKRVGSFNHESYSMSIRGGTPPLRLSSDVNSKTVGGNTNIYPNQWYHVVMVFDGTLSANNLKQYINGVPDNFATIYSTGTTLQTTVPRNNTANLHIGAYDTADQIGWMGLIDDVRIYNTALTLAQVQELYIAVPSDMGPTITLSNSTVTGTAGIPFSLGATATTGGTSALTYGWSTLSGPASAVFSNPSAASTNATCSLGGAFTLQLTANDGTIATFGDVTASISNPAGFSAWVGKNGLTGANATEMAIPAKDSISNLLKYALNLSPLADGAEGLPTVGSVTVNGTNYLSLSYTQVLAATDVTYTPEVSGDLQTWNSGSNYTTVVSTTPDTGGLTQTVVVRDLVPFAGASKRFIHLRVVGP